MIWGPSKGQLLQIIQSQERYLIQFKPLSLLSLYMMRVYYVGGVDVGSMDSICLCLCLGGGNSKVVLGRSTGSLSMAGCWLAG